MIDTFSKQEKKIFQKGYSIIGAIDEVGRGPLAGPVTAAIVVIKNPLRTDSLNSFIQIKRYLEKVKDSKQLSEKQREEIFEAVKDTSCFQWRVSFVSSEVIDRINIWQATLLVWQRCLEKMKSIGQNPDFLFLDGKFTLERVKIPQQSIVKGDEKIFLLSLASIIAKVTRDRWMKKLDQRYPQYGFAQHKGYGTKFHLERLKKYGPSPIHRRSFKPVFDCLSFREKVYYTVSQIPKGQVMTYKEVAEKIGHPRAYRAVGNVLSQNTNPKVPCHRVIRSDGKLGGYNQGTIIKKIKLQKEGVKF